MPAIVPLSLRPTQAGAVRVGHSQVLCRRRITVRWSTRRTGVIVMLYMSASVAACNSAPDTELPQPKQPGAAVDKMISPECAVDIPPITRQSSTCQAGETADKIKPADVCRLVTALKDWMGTTPLEPPAMQPNDWSRVRAITVCRLPYPPASDSSDMKSANWRLWIEADVPGRPRLFWAAMAEADRKVSFGTTHRGGG